MKVLPAVDVAPRLDRLRVAMAAQSIEALLVTGPTNVRYLSGFTGSAGRLVVRPERTSLLIDRRYEGRAVEETSGVGFLGEIEVVGSVTDAPTVARMLAGSPVVSVEAAHLTWAEHDALAEAMTLAPTTGLVEGLRALKDAAEVARVEAAAMITDSALTTVMPMIGSGATEAEIAFELEVTMRRLGADGPAYDPIVASGPNAAVPHHASGGRRIQPGDMVIVDVGARVDGYRSDMTRTYLMGDVAPEAVGIVKLVTDLQARGVASVHAGTTAAAVDEVCRRGAAEAGRLDEYLHSTGHGVGLDIHESPILRRGGATLHAGHVITVEPGIYVAGLGGARVEDTVLVTAEGCRRLTGSPRQPFLAA